MPTMKKAKTRALSLAEKIMAAQIAGQPSKYRVETEKNLDKVLAAATSSNTTLIADDADDLFGKRSPAKPQ